MLFELSNPATEDVSLLEFIADEGMIYMPYWVGILSVLSFSSVQGAM